MCIVCLYVHYSHYNCIVTQSALRNCDHCIKAATGRRTQSHQWELLHCSIVHTLMFLRRSCRTVWAVIRSRQMFIFCFFVYITFGFATQMDVSGNKSPSLKTNLGHATEDDSSKQLVIPAECRVGLKLCAKELAMFNAFTLHYVS